MGRRGLWGGQVVAGSKYAALKVLESLRGDLNGITVSFAINPSDRPALEGIVEAAKNNFGRVLELANLPTNIFGKGYYWYRAEQVISATLNAQVVASDEPIAPNVEAIYSGLIPHALEQVAQVYRDIWMRCDFADVRKFYDETQEAFDEVYPGGSIALMSGLITGTWTAFEVLAEDLWDVAAGARPATLLDSFKKSEKERGRKDRVSKVKISIDVAELKDCHYNLSGKVGQIFKADTSFGLKFDTYDGLRTAYEKAFGESHGFSAFDSQQDRSLLELSQVRNAIVHCAGNADKQFISTMVQNDSPHPEFANLSENDSIPIDGEITKTLVAGGLKASVKLISDVDQWLCITAE